MMIEEALNAYLASFAGLTALVGVNLFPLSADQRAALPWVVFQKISDAPAHALGQLPTLTQDRFQFTAWSGSYRTSKLIKQQLVIALNCFQGVMGGAGGVNVGSCLKVDENEGFEGDPRAYFVRLDFMIWHDDTT